MRLINATTFELEEFNTQNCPAYAILSHRWVHGEEVSFQDIKGAHRQWMPGWAKIQFCCRQAIKDNLSHVWVDTCCIDKDSSAELSEAINSMYEWYKRAKVCYAYLNDVVVGEDADVSSAVANSLWFTRAWTLQELLAPSDVVFYDKNFSRLSSKYDLAKNTQYLKQIPARVLLDPDYIKRYPVAVRMSWAADREATRVEDIAYSLFGICQVNLPLLYGEGDRAFIRLQEEIIKQSHDHSIFAWTAKDIEPVRLGSSIVLPLLAPSITLFESCSNIDTMEEDHEIRAYTMTNIGLEIELQVTPYDLNIYAALLDCGPGSHRIEWTRYAILLARESTRTSRFYRVTVNGMSVVQVRSLVQFQWQKMHIVRSPAIEYRRRTKTTGTEKSSSPAQLYGIRIQAPRFLRAGAAVRPYALVAYHDWEDDGPLNMVTTRKLLHGKHTSQSANELGPLSNIDLAHSGQERASSVILSNSLKQFLGRDENHVASRLAQRHTTELLQGDTQFQSAFVAMRGQGSDSRATMHRTQPSLPKVNLNSVKNSRFDEQQTHDKPAARKPIGSLEMPLLSTGTAGIIHFDRSVHGIKSIKAGFDFDFTPVVFLATDEADTDLEIQRWTQSTRFVPLRSFEQRHYLLDDFHGEGARHFWTLTPDTLRNRTDLEVEEGVIRVNKGIYAFKPKNLTRGEHWIFKPNANLNWHLGVELHKVEGTEEAYWELNIKWHEDPLAISIQEM